MMTTNKDKGTDMEHEDCMLKANVKNQGHNTTDKELNEITENLGTEDDFENCTITNQSNKMEDDDERDLTNLTWLTKLRNQTIGLVNITLNGEPRKQHESLFVSIERQDTVPASKQQRGIAIRTHKLEDQQNGVKIYNRSKRPSPTERYEIFLTKIKRDFRIYQESSTDFQSNANEKPPFNYAHIIGMAMLDNDSRMTLQQICSWIERKFAYFRVRKKWNNSIRHNLSLHSCFRKMGRNKGDKGKGGYWELGVDPKKCDRKRIRHRKNLSQTAKLRRNVQNQYVKLSKKRQQILHNLNLLNTRKTSFNQCNVNETRPEKDLLTDSLDVQQNVDVFSCYSNNACVIPSKENFKSRNISTSKENYIKDDDILNIQKSHELKEFSNGNQLEIDTHTQKQEKIPYQRKQSTFETNISSLPNLNLEGPNIKNLPDVRHQTIINTEVGVLQNKCISHITVLNDEDNNCDYETETIQCDHHNSLSLLSSIRLDLSSFASQSIQQKNVIVEQLVQPSPNFSVIGFSSNILPISASTLSAEYSNELCNEDFRPYIDGIDEAFQYLRSIDNTRHEDILDNLLDISVSDY